MSDKTIQRVDDIPLVVHWLLRMRVHEIIDHILPYPHSNWQGLSYGQLTLLFLAYVLHLRTHRLCWMEKWVQQHHQVLEQATGWTIRLKDATDDRLGELLTVLGEDEERGLGIQRELGQHLIQAYALPTKVGRFDTTTFSVHHAPPEAETKGQELLNFGHSKDRRPDLVQFKQSLGTLDPAGVPLLTGTWPGNTADDPLYLPAWQEMTQIIGHRHFLFVADCKAAALTTRAELDRAGGSYLFPLPMTGTAPEQLRQWVLEPPVSPTPITVRDDTVLDREPRVIGRGFAVEQRMTAMLADQQTQHIWTEHWLITCSDVLAKQQQKGLLARLHKAEAELSQLNARGHENATDLQAKAESIVQRRRVDDFITLQVEETVTQETHYIGRGRPSPNRPTQVVKVRQAHLIFHRNEAILAEALHLTGWRIHVTNVPTETMSLDQAITYYRGEWRVERGFHRFKGGSLPALPLSVRLPERIRGLMLLLLIALQALTLLEFVAQRELAERKEALAGLVPGNPKMKTTRPSAERLLSQFTDLNLLLERTEKQIMGVLIEKLTPLQRRILALLGVPETVYALDFSKPAHNCFDST